MECFSGLCDLAYLASTRARFVAKHGLPTLGTALPRLVPDPRSDFLSPYTQSDGGCSLAIGSAGARFPSQEEPKSPAMPSDERFGLDYRQGRFPVQQPRPHDKRGSGGIGEAMWSDFALFVESQLLAEEEVLSR